MKIAFIGGGHWGTPLLKPMIEAGHSVIVVDSPRINGKTGFCGGLLLRRILHKNRLLQITYSLLTARGNIFYETIWKYKLPVIVTKSINSKSFGAKIKRHSFDIILVASCAEIIDEEILKIPQLGCINYHPTLLPKYRGPNPFYWVLKNKEKETGITFHYIHRRIDAGDIILQRKVAVETGDDEESLISKCTYLATAAIGEALRCVGGGNVKVQPQDERAATYYPAASIRPSDKFYIKELSDNENRLWDELINESAQYNFFSSSFWLDIVSKATGMWHKKIICTQENQALCGCAALVKKSLEGNLLTSGPLSQYSTILHFPVKNGAAFSSGMSQVYKQLKSLLAISNYIKSRFDWAILYLHPNFEDSAVFKQEGWGLDSRYTYYLDLRDAEKLYANFDTPLKRQIKKGQRGDFQIKEGMEQPELFYGFWQETMKKQKINPPLTLKGFSYIYQQLKQNNLLKTFCAYHGNTLAAAVIFIIDKEMSYYWASTLNKEYAVSGINQVLLWEGLNCLSRGGVKDFDFVGADIPSIASYKKSYGGRLVMHSRIMYSSSLRAKAVQGAKTACKSFIRKHD